MAQEWRNNEQRVRMREDAAPTPKPGKINIVPIVILVVLLATARTVI